MEDGQTGDRGGRAPRRAAREQSTDTGAAPTPPRSMEGPTARGPPLTQRPATTATAVSGHGILL